MALIELHHIDKCFEQNGEKIPVLKDINRSIHAADIYGIIGMSGAGKAPWYDV